MTGLPLSHQEWIPTILFEVNMLNKAIQYSRHGATLAAPRVAQFELAATITHELAHVFTRFCHGRDKGPTFKEPLILPTEAFPECDFSFENFMFGSNLHALV
jgi:hypothetical protein